MYVGATDPCRKGPGQAWPPRPGSDLGHLPSTRSRGSSDWSYHREAHFGSTLTCYFDHRPSKMNGSLC